MNLRWGEYRSTLIQIAADERLISMTLARISQLELYCNLTPQFSRKAARAWLYVRKMVGRLVGCNAC